MNTKTSADEWENLCDGCANCCEIGDTGVGCPFLDVVTRRCTVYEDRMERAPWCVKITPHNLPALHKHKILPDSCAYVRHSKGQTPLEDPPVAHLIPYTLADRHIVEKHVRLANTIAGSR